MAPFNAETSGRILAHHESPVPDVLPGAGAVLPFRRQDALHTGARSDRSLTGGLLAGGQVGDCGRFRRAGAAAVLPPGAAGAAGTAKLAGPGRQLPAAVCGPGWQLRCWAMRQPLLNLGGCLQLLVPEPGCKGWAMQCLQAFWK